MVLAQAHPQPILDQTKGKLSPREGEVANAPRPLGAPATQAKVREVRTAVLTGRNR